MLAGLDRPCDEPPKAGGRWELRKKGHWLESGICGCRSVYRTPQHKERLEGNRKTPNATHCLWMAKATWAFCSHHIFQSPQHPVHTGFLQSSVHHFSVTQALTEA